METAEVVIAGAGIIGLSLAVELASLGMQVAVLERGRAMAESSYAAAGMLAGNDPELNELLDPLASLSGSLYPEFLDRVEGLSRMRVPFRTDFALQGLDARTNPVPGQKILDAAVLQQLAPGLKPDAYRWIRRDGHSLDPRDLCRALPAAAHAAGVALWEKTPVTAIEPQGNGVLVRSSEAVFHAKHFVNATGAWAQSLLWISVPDISAGGPRIFPCKGQMLVVREGGPQRLQCVLRTPEIYLVPRGDGRIVIGATMEQAGFDKTVDPSALATLRQTAALIYPAIADAEAVDAWAGVRPGSSDELPLIGPGLQPNTWIATGHFRNGILLAPATARVLAQLIANKTPDIDLTAFAPSRKVRPLERPLDRHVPPASDNRSTAAL